MRCKRHTWLEVDTPPDQYNQWLRCSICGAMGYGRKIPSGYNAKAYRCVIRGCNSPAVGRRTGRTTGGACLWYCDAHRPNKGK